MCISERMNHVCADQQVAACLHEDSALCMIKPIVLSCYAAIIHHIIHSDSILASLQRSRHSF